MIELANAERETHFNIVADDRSTVHIFSDDPVMQRRIEKVGTVLVKQDQHAGKHYTLPANQLSLRRPRKLTDMQREGLAQRIRSARKTPTIVGAK